MYAVKEVDHPLTDNLDRALKEAVRQSSSLTSNVSPDKVHYT
jgi:hypothetical protein